MFFQAKVLTPKRKSCNLNFESLVRVITKSESIVNEQKAKLFIVSPSVFLLHIQRCKGIPKGNIK